MTEPLFQHDLDPVIRDAQSSEGKTPAERMAMFADLLAATEAVLKNLSPEERIRRQQISDALDARPDPWWKNLRPAAWPEEQCNDS